MAYAVFKWKFRTAVHFGTDKGYLAQSDYVLKSDTLFAALCQECLKIGGEAMLERLYQRCQEGKLRFSDALPFAGETYYLPKPVLQVPRASGEHDSVLKKAHKNLSYIDAEKMTAYLQSLKGAGDFDALKESEKFQRLFTEETRVMAHVKGQADTLPFYLSAYRFAARAGLYVLVRYQDGEDIAWLKTVMDALGLSGVGGKRSSGLGHFEVDDVIYLDKAENAGLKKLRQMLDCPAASYYMTLSCALPKDEELGQVLTGEVGCAYYTLLKRGGFVASAAYAPQPMKRKTLYLFDSGSCFRHKFDGDIYNVARDGAHAVWRYGLPLFVGVDI